MKNKIIFISIATFALFGLKNIIMNQINATENDKQKHITELPIQEQLAHKSLMKKLGLIRIHQDYIHCQSDALLRFMEILEDEKDNDGNLAKNQLIALIDTAKFPELTMMKPQLEAISNDPFLGYKAKYCLELLSENNKDIVYRWFEVLENEILVDINTYEDAGMDFPQYKFMLGMYTKAKSSLKFQCQMMMLMSPKLFNETDSD